MSHRRICIASVLAVAALLNPQFEWRLPEAPRASMTSCMVFVPLASQEATLQPAHSAVAPVARGDEGWWKTRFEAANERVRSTPQTKLIFIGDSITQGWEGEGAAIWKERYAELDAINLGFSGDRTQHVLWRLQNGDIARISPEACVLMIGTNNSNGEDNSVAEIADGVTAIVNLLRQELPETKILLLDIFPRGASPNPQRGKVLQVNQIIRKLDDGERVLFLDIGHHFVDERGDISRDIMPDALHLSPRGYEIWANTIAPVLTDLLSD